MNQSCLDRIQVDICRQTQQIVVTFHQLVLTLSRENATFALVFLVVISYVFKPNFVHDQINWAFPMLADKEMIVIRHQTE